MGQHNILSIIIAGFLWVWTHLYGFVITIIPSFVIISMPPIEGLLEIIFLKYLIPIVGTFIAYASNANKVNKVAGGFYKFFKWGFVRMWKGIFRVKK